MPIIFPIEVLLFIITRSIRVFVAVFALVCPHGDLLPQTRNCVVIIGIRCCHFPSCSPLLTISSRIHASQKNLSSFSIALVLLGNQLNSQCHQAFLTILVVSLLIAHSTHFEMSILFDFSLNFVLCIHSSHWLQKTTLNVQFTPMLTGYSRLVHMGGGAQL